MVLPASWIELFVPGRLCLFGEHSDWAGHYRKHNADLLPGRTLVVGDVAMYSEGSDDPVAHVVGTYAIPPSRAAED